MSSSTKIAEGEQPVITVHPNHIISEINDNTYGGFTEYAVFPTI